MKELFRFVCFCGCFLMSIPALAQPFTPSLKGSRASVHRMFDHTVVNKFPRFRTREKVKEFVEAKTLVELTGNENYRLVDVSHPYVLPEVRTFVERLSAQSRVVCSVGLIVTSGTRPEDEQPSNASPFSVHPNGMAVDLRIPDRKLDGPKCGAWLRRTLLAMEGKKVLEVTLEKHPAHYHVGVFPEPYAKYLAEKTKPKVGVTKKKTPIRKVVRRRR